MARIRSVHPGLFTDEQFVELSADAQIFLVGLGTQADDQGVFEWKPGTLRMRLRPTKDGSVEDLLAELETRKLIRSYEIDGRKYGAVRNFRKHQKPKKPNSTYPTTDEIRTYVGLQDKNSEPSEPKQASSSPPVPNQFGNRPSEGEEGRREDGGWRGGEEVARRFSSEIGTILDRIEPKLNSPLPLTGQDISPWLRDGASPELIVETILSVAERRRSKAPDWYPKGLKYFDGAVREAMAKEAAARPAPPSPEGRRTLLETYAKLVRAGRRLQAITAEDLEEMQATGLITEAELARYREAA